MAHNPKLEIFKVYVNPKGDGIKTWGDFRNEKYPDAEDKFTAFFADFIGKIDAGGFIQNSKMLKALTAYEAGPGNLNPTVKIKKRKHLVYGKFEGGKYGQRRSKSEISNKARKEPVESGSIIMDQYFFCLYTPSTSDKGILFVQSYSGDNVTDLFKTFIQSFLSLRPVYKKAAIEKYVPQSFIEQFKNGAFVKRFRYSTDMVFNHPTNDPVHRESEDFSVKVELTAKHGIDKDALSSWVREIGSKIFGGTRLDQYPKGKVVLINADTNKESPFEIDSDFDIRPVIYLSDRITIDVDGIPNFTQLAEYCETLLTEEIIPAVYPTHAVQEH